MKKYILLILFVFIFCSTVNAGTVTSKAGGNWSAGSTWDSDPAIPAAGDDVIIANGHTVVWDAGATTRLPATSGTYNSITCQGSGTITLALATIGNCSLYATNMTPGTSNLLAVSGTTSNTCTITGNILAGGAGGVGVYNTTSNGTTAIVGSVTGGTGANGYGVNNGNSGTITISGGNLTGGSNASAYGAYNTSSGTITITGNVTGVTAFGARNATGTLNVIGNVTGGSASTGSGIYSSSSGAINISNGTIKGGSIIGAWGINNIGTATVTLTNCNIDETGSDMAYNGKPPVLVPTSGNTVTTNKSGGGTVTFTYGKFGMMP